MPALAHLRGRVGVLALLALLPLGCNMADNAGSGTAETSPSAAEQACNNIISLIGYAELVLLPAEQANEQTFDINVRGRIAESIGTAEREAEALPAELRGQALALAEAGKGLTNAQTPHDEQVAALLEWRQIAEEIERDCAEIADG